MFQLCTTQCIKTHSQSTYIRSYVATVYVRMYPKCTYVYKTGFTRQMLQHQRASLRMHVDGMGSAYIHNCKIQNTIE